MRCLLCVVLTLWLTAPGLASDKPLPPDRILIIADASATAGHPLGMTGETVLGIARALLDALDPVFTDLQLTPEVAVRIFGGGTPGAATELCHDTRLVREWAPAPTVPLRGALDNVSARGSSPLARALTEAAADLGEPSKQDLVLVLLDGLDSCGGDVGNAISNLLRDGEGASVYFFSFGLATEDQGVIADLAPLHIVGSHRQVTSWAVNIIQRRPHFTPPPKASPATLIIEDIAALAELATPVASVAWTDPTTGEVNELDPAQSRHEILVTAGISSLVASTATGVALATATRIPVMPGRTHEVRLAPTAGATLEIEVEAPSWEAYHSARVHWLGAPDDQLQLVVAPIGATGADWFCSNDVAGPDGETSIPLPIRGGFFELQLRRRSLAGDVVMVSREVELPGRFAELDAPKSVFPGSVVSARWVADPSPGDWLTLVVADASPESTGQIVPALEAAQPAFDAPNDRCTVEIRYLDGATLQVLARERVEVSAPLAGLLADDEAPAGRPFEVRWWGPAGDNDIITLADPETDGLDYIAWAPTSQSSPAPLVAPATTREVELRYVTAHGDILARRSIELTPVAVELIVPKTVQAGRRIEVRWIGPNQPSDFIAVVKKGKGLKAAVDLAYVTVGSPTTLATPFSAGTIEVRYVAGASRKVLASAQVEVVD